MDTLGQMNSLLDNETFSTVTSLVIALYAGMAAPALPNSVILFFDTLLGKLLFLFLIGFMASRNIRIALMIAVAFVVTLHVVNQRTTEQYFNFRKEHFNTEIEEGGENPQKSIVDGDGFTVNVDEDMANGPPVPEEAGDVLAEDITLDQTENFIQNKDTFRNYRLENFQGNDIEEGGDNIEEGGDNIEEGGDNIEESDPIEEGGPEQGPGSENFLQLEDEDGAEGFYSNINPTVKNFGVNPAHNTSGSSGHMFAPVKFH